MGVIFVFSVCIHVCIFGGDEIECYLSIQGMYGYKKIFDGAALVDFLIPRAVCTFGEYAEQIFLLFINSQQVRRVDIV